MEVRPQSEVDQLQPPPAMGSLTPGHSLVIKRLFNLDGRSKRQRAETEETVLKSLAGRDFAPEIHGSFISQEPEEGSGVLRPSANLIIG